ncbi:uncharacterized protein LOC142504934 [Primulina tabacum]|uniref:uncharacterized protein LOC142504934 n=1 Tax=Primulina tabacum TaxID=48773 RepID=UPI003F599853
MWQTSWRGMYARFQCLLSPVIFLGVLRKYRDAFSPSIKRKRIRIHDDHWRLGITGSTTETQLAIALPSGQELQTDQVVRGCPIYVQGHQMYAEFIVLKMTDFEVILRMDWLSKYKVTIECGIKMIKFAPVGAEPFTVASVGISLPLRIISCMKSCKLLQKGCQGYLASMLTIDPPVRELKDTYVVCEFSEVFPDVVTGLPPDREIEFVIDIVT